ncbi:MAG: hypothetical protein KDD56_05790 [Bdellovibrionales bacterium]|nr:hypothetical protein [Bdellovibrionales bacterium]
MQQHIEIRGAKQNNLKSISLKIPLNKLVVITGVSGSGKTSLAIETLYAEANRRYLENLSLSSAMGHTSLPRPNVDFISDTLPAIGLFQNFERKTNKETILTFCDTYRLLQVLFAKEGSFWCRKRNIKLSAYTASQVLSAIMQIPENTKIEIYAPVNLSDLSLKELLARGYTRVILDGETFLLDEDFVTITKLNPKNVKVVIDRVKIKKTERQRVFEAVELAYKLSNGEVEVHLTETTRILNFADKIFCETCGITFSTLTPESLSFSSPKGVCLDCSGTGELNLDECKTCKGTRLNQQGMSVAMFGVCFSDLMQKSISEAVEILTDWQREKKLDEAASFLLVEILKKLSAIDSMNLSYLPLKFPLSQLSSGEYQRLRIARQMTERFGGLLYVLDEPSRALDPNSLDLVINSLKELVVRGNTVVVVDHKKAVINAADYIVDIGPGAGASGGNLIFAGDISSMSKTSSLTAKYLANDLKINHRAEKLSKTSQFVNFSSVKVKGYTVSDFCVPLNALSVITGDSGSGKTLLAREIIFPLLSKKKFQSDFGGVVKGADSIIQTKFIEESIVGDNVKSTLVTVADLFDSIRTMFSQLPDAKVRGWDKSRFSYNSKESRCSVCQGNGEIKIEMNLLAPVFKTCELCNGSRYNSEVAAVKFKGFSIQDVMAMSVAEAAKVFLAIPNIQQKLELLEDVGLAYLKLGQATRTLSGGEKQRISLVKDLTKTNLRDHFIIIDEPSTGLHFADLSVLLKLLQKIVEKGNTVLLLDHNTDIIAAAAYYVKLEIDRMKNHIKVKSDV